jgi:hypothetical protein
MATQYTCAFSIPANSSQGGRLTGGFANNVQPTLQNGDSILVTVTCAAPPAGNTLTGAFIYTAAGNAPSNQTAPSPFVRGANKNFLCVQSYPGTPSGNSGQVTITFPAWTYAGGNPGSYEMTFVAWNQATGQQWSEDPEFETGN